MIDYCCSFEAAAGLCHRLCSIINTSHNAATLIFFQTTRSECVTIYGTAACHQQFLPQDALLPAGVGDDTLGGEH